MTTEPTWNGVEGTPSEHRTTGLRAYCHGCSEWCYCAGGDHCRCCQIVAEGYYLDVRGDMQVSGVQRYPTGTIQITIKKR